MRGIALQLAVLFLASSGWAQKLPLEKLKLPMGFKISVWAQVPNARSLAQAEDGRIFVGTRSGDKVYVVNNGKVQVLAEGLDTPNGVAYKDGKLYVAEISRILEFDVSKPTNKPLRPARTLPQKFPSDTHHGWKFIRFGPDGKLYVPVGANCNVCDPGTDFARIFRIDVNGTAKEEVARGVRNTVGFDFHPQTKELWFTDNGRDWMGDDRPPCELNHLSKVGENFGFPVCHGKDTLDPEFGKGKSCKDFTAPVVELKPHVAPLGMRFYTGNQFPAQYKDAVIIAEHGSWNRSTPSGYRLTFVKLNGNQAEKVETFVDGWLQGDTHWGRPVDLEVLKDGSLLVSDDRAGVIYRITYQGK
ncbi:PQQ-dependent sugar dehydrogenase [Bdellovibrio sp. 22V]|uniref:PQQ-dependent sugar dehydrogenase n=1 Tax=Bdellovibrio TaxID=958 RepID=UPI002543F4F6|nr:PQQ-dependent sugar dehydrogenase [Bdellovibrio sp. 22V]WII71304.1 PQQ-dependent sugar dehydrogenase [Bdellovibrio sp. 22V]